jgi:hypothetical protein
MIYAKPNLNGNSKADFETVAQILHDNATNIVSVLSILATDVMHERNYQSGQDNEARVHDLQKLALLTQMSFDLNRLAIEVYDAQRDTQFLIVTMDEKGTIVEDGSIEAVDKMFRSIFGD